MGNSIEAKLIIAANVAEAIKALQALKKESRDTSAAVSSAVTGQPQGGEDGVKAARRQANERSSAEKLAAREALNAQREAVRERRDVEKKANAERSTEEQRATREARTSANLQKQAYRQLPAQITDITTSIASGMPIWMVAIQQGGQIKDSFGGAAPAARALASALTPLRLIVGGVAAALGVMAFAVYKGHQEQDGLNKQLALTGNIAGTSVAQVNSLAREISGAQRAAIGDVRETLAALLATGNYTSANLGSAGRAVTALRKLTGQSAQEAVASFESQGDGITAWALKANRAYNFMTAAQLAHVRQLEAGGRTSEAVQLVNDELARTLEQRAVPAVGKLERAWNAVGKALSQVLDNFKSLFRDEEPAAVVKRLQARLDALVQARDGGATRGGKRRTTFDTEIAAAQAELDAVRSQIDADAQGTAERAAALRTEHEKTYRQSKEFQDALAAVDLAGAQRSLAQLEAALDAEAAVVARADASGLQTAEDKALKLNAIEQRRLEEQAELLRKQIESEIKRAGVDQKPHDKLNRQARVTGLEAQLLGVQSRIARTVAEAQGIVEAAAYEEARTRSKQWEQIWLNANERVLQHTEQNEATRASLETNAVARAEETARARVASAKREFQALETLLRVELETNPHPGQRGLIQEQLDRLRAESVQAIAEQERLARLGSVVQQLAEQLDALRLQEAAIDQQVQRGAATTEEAEQRKFAARDESLVQLKELLALQRDLARTPAERNDVARSEQEVKKLEDRVREVSKVLNSEVKSSVSSFVVDFVTGTKTAAEAFRGFIASVARAALELVAQRLGTQIADSLFPRDGQSGGYLAAIGTFVAGLFHAGGVVGPRVSGMARAVSPLVFAGAQVLHGGGLVLAANERPVIAKVGEEMLTEDDPRHVRNFRSGNVIGTLNVALDLGGGALDPRDQALAEGLARMVRAKVGEGIREEMRPGGLLEGRGGRG